MATVLSNMAALPAFAWGPNGHRTIGEIAQRYISDEAARQIAQLLDDRNLASVSNWADDIRSEERWDCTYPFHYSTIPPGTNYFDDGVPREGDALGAIVFFEELLSNRAAPKEKRVIALKFLVHFVGDVHQPLHVGLGCDRGGNDVQVEWFGEVANLHSVWDRRIYDSFQLSYSELVGFLDHIDETQVGTIQSSTPLDWLNESQEFQKEVYRCHVRGDGCAGLCGDCGDGSSVFGGCTTRSCNLSISGPITLSWEYRDRARPIVEDRLLKAGLRVAALLDWALSDSSAPAAYERMKARLKSDPDWDMAMRGCIQPPAN